MLVSGGGTNLEALFNAQAAGALPHGEIVAVVSSNPDAFALSGPDAAGCRPMPCPGSSWGRRPSRRRLTQKLRECRADLIVLAGFLSILSADFVRRWPDRIVNVHPSLIPAFCGKGYYGLRVHQAALERGVRGHRRHGPPGE